jgi:hypothetical protein
MVFMPLLWQSIIGFQNMSEKVKGQLVLSVNGVVGYLE